MFQKKTLTDRFDDDMTVSVVSENLHITATQKHNHDEPVKTYMSFTPEVACDLRNYLLKLFPLPLTTGETSVESVGELTSITTSGGSIVINATGNVIINQK